MKHIICLLWCYALLSCKNEEETFHLLNFDTDGIVLVHNSQTGTFDGVIPANGSIFTLTGEGEFSDLVYISSMIINGFSVKVGCVDEFPRPATDSNVIINGEWGEIQYLTENPPYVIKFKFNPNYDDTLRKYDIQLGYGYWCSHIILEQPHLSN